MRILILIAGIIVSGNNLNAESWFLDALPTRVKVSSVSEKPHPKGGLWTLEICLKAYNPILVGDYTPTMPTKKAEGHPTKSIFTNSNSKASLSLDWSKMAHAKIQWFDSTFTEFDSGKPKEVEYRWSRTHYLPDNKGYLVCADIPFEVKYKYTYIQKKLSSQFVLGLIHWPADFYLQRHENDKIVDSYFFEKSQQTNAIIGIALHSGIGEAVSDLYESLNIIGMLRIADNTINVDNIDDFMQVKELRDRQNRLLKECGMRTQPVLSTDVLKDVSLNCKERQ